jgi:protein-S-isoprenylcysteine O-methyltransferase Ste14
MRFASRLLVVLGGIGLLMVALLLPVCIPRLNAEESMLLSEFGERYEAYRSRTWRRLPFVY